jgi:putative FmdB family regulatory protein
MPIYEYHCQACGQRFEKLVKLSTRPQDVECPVCGQRKARKAISLVGAVNSAAPGAPPARAACGPTAST